MAFADSDGFRLMCPYDEDALDPAVVHEARCSHPLVSHEHGAHASHDFRSSGLLAPFEAPLPPPPAPVEVHSFEIDTLHEVRQIVARAGQRAGLREDRVEDLVLAVNELAANSTLHGRGRGVLRVWRDQDTLVCEVRDRGHIHDPLAGRYKPDAAQSGGWGLWIVNQVCDLVQVRTGADGTVVRAIMRPG